jgi:hypothetical protein
VAVTVFFSILLILLGKTELPGTSFEGVIEYAISYPNQRNPISNSVPTKYRISFKEGNIRKEYRNSQDSLLFYSIYVLKSNTNYGIKPGSDTITYYTPSPSMLDSSSTSLEKGSENDVSTILQYSCIKYVVQIKYKVMPENEPPIKYTYFVAPSLNIDKKYIQGDGSNFVYTPTGSIILKYISEDGILKVVEAKKIVMTELDKELFYINAKGKCLKEI